MAETQHVYPMREKLGSCIVFNMKYFKHEKTRDGTEVDKDKINTTFRKLGYKMRLVENPSKTDVEQNMVEVLDDVHRESSSFICFILSHGSWKNMICTYDEPMHLNDIVQMTDVPALQGKPKIFVIQACRGGNVDSGMNVGKDEYGSPIEVEDMILTPRQQDLLLIYATPPGYASSRNPRSGSCFIQMFCDLLEQERNSAPVCVLLQRLTMAMSHIPRRYDEYGFFTQVPYFMSTLRKSLLLRNSFCSGNIQFTTPNIIKDTQAEVSKRLDGLFRKSCDKGSLAYHFLLKESNGCYDVSTRTERHCLVINKTTTLNSERAEEDCTLIRDKMTTLQFKVSISNGWDKWEDKLKYCMSHKNLGCFFCFIQIDAKDDTSDNKLVAEVIDSVKQVDNMLNKPKVYIIQPYETVILSKTDSSDVDSGTSLTNPVRHSKEADVLMVHVLPAAYGKISFIEMFCNEYVKNAETVPIMGFLERILPQKYERYWVYLVPTVCSTMRKHLMMKDKFTHATYQPEFSKPIEAVLDVADGIRNFFRKL